MASNKSLGLVDQFIGDHVLLYLSGLDSTMTTETGDQSIVPMVLEGILWDHDGEYLLLGDDAKTTFSLVSKSSIVKIDIQNDIIDVMSDPNKPNKKEMN